MKLQEDIFDVGVAVGRFQVASLHWAHHDLIEQVCKRHDKVLVFVGLSAVKGGRENPLDFEARKQMILADFPNVTVGYVEDSVSDAVWSKNFDREVRKLLTPSQSVVVYGGRDSFIERYHGKLPTRQFEQESYTSGSEQRRHIASHSTKGTSEFREGVIWGVFNRFATCFPTVDIEIRDETETKILLGRKPDETQFRLPGGFIDPEKDKTAESAARREAYEETRITITDPKYVASVVVDDWRYRNEVDKIMTFVFRAKVLQGPVLTGIRSDLDDLAETRWFEVAKIKRNEIVSTHHPLFDVLGIELH